MDLITPIVDRLGGLLTTADLTAGGASRRMIAQALEDDVLVRIRTGWFATTDSRFAPDAAVIRAVRAGGSLTCVSAAALRGWWTDARHPERLHISVPHSTGVIRDPESGRPVGGASRVIEVHWDGPALIESRGLVPAVIALRDLVRCSPPDHAFATVESVIRAGGLSFHERNLLTASVSRATARDVSVATHRSESGSESLFLYRMTRLGIALEAQAEIPGVGRVDFRIGDRLLVEIDSSAHHSSNAQRLRDLRRDTTAAGLGYLTLRFDYDQVLNDWASVEATILAVIARGDHLAMVRR